MAIPASVISAMMFTVPRATEGLQLAYALITNVLLTAIAFTAINIPYCSLQVVRTESTEERSKMGVWRSLAGYLSGAVITIGIIPITNAQGGDQIAWVKLGFIMALCIF